MCMMLSDAWCWAESIKSCFLFLISLSLTRSICVYVGVNVCVCVGAAVVDQAIGLLSPLSSFNVSPSSVCTFFRREAVQRGLSFVKAKAILSVRLNPLTMFYSTIILSSGPRCVCVCLGLLSLNYCIMNLHSRQWERASECHALDCCCLVHYAMIPIKSFRLSWVYSSFIQNTSYF